MTLNKRHKTCSTQQMKGPDTAGRADPTRGGYLPVRIYSEFVPLENSLACSPAERSVVSPVAKVFLLVQVYV